MPKEGTVKLSLELSLDVNAKLEDFARRAHTTKSEVLRRSLGLYDIAAEAKEDGNKLGLLDKDRQVITEIISV